MNAHRDDYDTPILRPKNVIVIGGGNVAMDAARCAKRLGANHVYIIYRRSELEMPARREEIDHAREEGIELVLLANPIKIIGDDDYRVNSVECVQMTLTDPDVSGRRAPVAIPGSNFILAADCVIMAIGNSPNPLIGRAEPSICTNKMGHIVIDDYMATTKRCVYAGGDVVSGAATVILAMGAGKIAAKSIDNFIRNQ